ncbi:MAG: phosphate/phosphite/phosphonate ABC transporter substrate-binding protein [Proteobacteria bacterium]|nr:phosphate/phosphite/phosphonate ABC transporter substrate-binding protein [Pseudomonadota bacterium]MBU1688569.1 phosphate/phosphite/phosphonate ABC transporter substrate-binding protein [Pseudomonadota bacterium]
MKKTLLVLLTILLLAGLAGTANASGDVISCWFPPDWKSKAPQAKAITTALSEHSGLNIQPRIAKSYPEIFAAFSADANNMVYVGSFVQAIIKAQDIGTPLVQNVNGKEHYSGVLIYPKGENPQTLLAENPAAVAYAVGASSGESSAKAATGGKAAVPTPNHGASIAAVKADKAKTAVVKNWWWESNREKYPEMAMYEIPGISLIKNPDNVLTVSKKMAPEVQEKIKNAAIASKDAFGAPEMRPLADNDLDFSLSLMKKGGIDPLTYSW